MLNKPSDGTELRRVRLWPEIFRSGLLDKVDLDIDFEGWIGFK